MRTLHPPSEITQSAFVLLWDRIERVYVLHFEDGRSFDLGEPQQTLRYFIRLGMRELGERAMDASYNFEAAMVLVKEQRAFALDFDVDGGGEKVPESVQLFGAAEPATLIA